MSGTVGTFADQDAVYAVEEAILVQLLQHPVNAVGALTYFFYE